MSDISSTLEYVFNTEVRRPANSCGHSTNDSIFINVRLIRCQYLLKRSGGHCFRVIAYLVYYLMFSGYSNNLT
jgi:hypothetical protein